MTTHTPRTVTSVLAEVGTDSVTITWGLGEPVDVGDVEEFFEVIRSDVALVLQLGDRRLDGLGQVVGHEPLPFFFARFLPTGC